MKETFDLTIGLFVRMVKNSIVHLPHSATVQAKCRILNFDVAVFLDITINQSHSVNSIHPMLHKLNTSFEVRPTASIKGSRDFCLFEPILYNKNGHILHGMRKFNIIIENEK